MRMVEVREKDAGTFIPKIVSGSTTPTGNDIDPFELDRIVQSDRHRLFVVTEDDEDTVVLAMTGRNIEGGAAVKTHMPFWCPAFDMDGIDWRAVVTAIRDWFRSNGLDHVWECTRANARFEWLERRRADFGAVYGAVDDIEDMYTDSTDEEMVFRARVRRRE